MRAREQGDGRRATIPKTRTQTKGVRAVINWTAVKVNLSELYQYAVKALALAENSEDSALYLVLDEIIDLARKIQDRVDD